MKNKTLSVVIALCTLLPAAPARADAGLVDIGIGAQGGYGKLDRGDSGGFAYGFDATAKLAMLGFGAFFDSVPFNTGAGSAFDGHLNVVGGAAYLYTPWPVEGLRVGAKLGSGTLSAASGTLSESGVVAGPSVGIETSLIPFFSLGLEADYLFAKDSLGGNAFMGLASIRFWL